MSTTSTPQKLRALSIALALLLGVAASLVSPRADACCPAPPSGKPVVNADQTVIIVWDAANKTQHFVRRASFKSEADDFGFLVPTPAQPELHESGNDAFPFLQKLTEPEVIQKSKPIDFGCGGCSRSKSAGAESATSKSVTVLEEKTVAGFDAVVLEASSASALTEWLKEKGYAFSPEVEAWAKPYVEGGWKITALRVAKDKSAGGQEQRVAASSLRLTFKTDRPLFPYREPDASKSAGALGASQRLLRIYFLSDARYGGELTKDFPWTGRVVWAGKLSADARSKTAELLSIAPSGAPEWWLTEFEDPWPYRAAPADLYFAASDEQSDVRREPIIQYTSVDAPPSNVSFATVLLLPIAWRLRRRRKVRQ